MDKQVGFWKDIPIYDSALGDNSLTLLCAPLPQEVSPIIPCRMSQMVDVPHKVWVQVHLFEHGNTGNRFGDSPCNVTSSRETAQITRGDQGLML